MGMKNRTILFGVVALILMVLIGSVMTKGSPFLYFFNGSMP